MTGSTSSYACQLKLVRFQLSRLSRLSVRSWSERSPVRRYVEEIGSVTKRSAGVTPEVNLRECETHMPPPSANKAEPTLALKPTEDVTRSPKQGYQWPHKKDSCPPKKNFKKNLFDSKLDH